MRRPVVLIAAVAIVVVAIVLVWQTRLREEPASGSRAERTDATRPARPTPGPQLPQPAPPSAVSPPPATFEQARATAIMRFEQDMIARLQTCVPPAAQKPPTMRAVRFVFDRHADRSAPLLQFFTVREVTVVDVAGIAPASRDCIEQTLGMPLMVPVPSEQLPADLTVLEQIVHLPVP